MCSRDGKRYAVESRSARTDPISWRLTMLATLSRIFSTFLAVFGLEPDPHRPTYPGLSAARCGPRCFSGSAAASPSSRARRPAGRHHLGSHGEARRPLAPQTAHPSPLAEPTLCRYPPEVGAGCLNRARPDLGGGHSVMGVPTAISRFSGIWLTAFLAGQSLALRKIAECRVESAKSG